MRCFWGYCINWLIIPIAHVISGLLRPRVGQVIKFLTNLYYCSLSASIPPSIIWNRLFATIIVSTSFQSTISTSDSKSRMYFHWYTKIVLFEWKTSISRKYFRPPRYFISNSVNIFFGVEQSPPCCLQIMSSTYIIWHVTNFPRLLKDNIWSALFCLYPYYFMSIVNLQSRHVEIAWAHRELLWITHFILFELRGKTWWWIHIYFFF